jgi:hypothetical protein
MKLSISFYYPAKLMNLLIKKITWLKKHYSLFLIIKLIKLLKISITNKIKSNEIFINRQ